MTPALYERSLLEDLAPLEGPNATRDLSAADPTEPNSYRLAFADPEFMARRETRGIGFQLELLKPDLDQQAMGIEHTVVVYGSARFVDLEAATQALQQAQASGDAQALALAERDMRNAQRYEAARRFAYLVAQYSKHHPTNQRVYVCTGGGPGIMEAANRGAYDAGAPNHRAQYPAAPRAARQPLHQPGPELQIPLLCPAQNALFDAGQGAGGIPRRVWHHG